MKVTRLVPAILCMSLSFLMSPGVIAQAVAEDQRSDRKSVV